MLELYQSGFESYYSNTGNSDYDVSLTGLALLCFLGAGSSTSSGPYCEVVKKGVQFILHNQQSDGLFGHSLFLFLIQKMLLNLFMKSQNYHLKLRQN